MSSRSGSLGLLGGGAQAKEIADYVSEQGIPISFFAIDPAFMEKGASIKTLDITDPPNGSTEIAVLVAVGAPGLKKQLIAAWPGTNYTTLISKHAWVSKTAEVGIGSVVAPASSVATDVKIGRHVLINIGVTLSHDVVVGDYVSISPGVHIGGRVVLGNGVFVGIGATIKNDIKIADGVVIGAGAVVVKDILEVNTVAVGLPANVINRNPGWLYEI